MTQMLFEPFRREDGTVDPACFEQMGLRTLKDWLRRRLGGSDQYFPLATRLDEDPEALVIHIIKDAGLSHPASQMIASALRDLLDESRASAPPAPAFFSSAIRICQRVKLPQTQSWFIEEIDFLAGKPNNGVNRWGDEESVSEVLYAALLQVPGVPRNAASAAWTLLLHQPQHTTIALLALEPTLSKQVRLLSVWWQTCPKDQRLTELKQLISSGLTVEGEAAIRGALREQGPGFSPDLRASVDKVLAFYSLEPIYSTLSERSDVLQSHCRAIAGAALRAEFVVPSTP